MAGTKNWCPSYVGVCLEGFDCKNQVTILLWPPPHFHQLPQFCRTLGSLSLSLFLSKYAFYLSYLTSQFLQGTRVFSELVLARMFLVDVRGSEPISSPAPAGQSAGIWRVVAGKMYARALDLSIHTGQYQSFSTGQNRQMESDLSSFHL